MAPFAGQTYSLYCDSDSTDDYFETIRQVADLCLEKFAGAVEPGEQGENGETNDKKLLAWVRKESKRGKVQAGALEEILKTSLSKYTTNVRAHLKSLTFFKRFDRTLRTTVGQYHLYMLEIELVNRIYTAAFNGCEYKFALLPHCLSDFRLKCLSVPGDIEQVCKRCTKECYINLGSHLLKEYNINPYISVTMDQGKLLKEVKARHRSVGVLGIACVPELAMGMRLAISLGMPVVGVPLDANRCARWMNKAYENSFNLKEVEYLLSLNLSPKGLFNDESR